jgi:ArsR family transcriptional regulator
VVEVVAVDAFFRQELDELVGSMCKALNDPKRLAVLYTLRQGPLSVGELCQALDAPQSNTSQHLAVLRDRGLVETERRGNTVLYSLRHTKVIEAIDILRDVMADEVARKQALRPAKRKSRPRVARVMAAKRTK